ncbi:DUF3800 domain-containing protein [Mesorhizobium sp. B3-1-6]|uniref:DUF3800 domain-containing protein n=1 Tax=Mesorhizobium sp. B3-1-6 TaxID=2589895 RepID=UPI00112C70DA|nr:DUF3800 domain-containing protein [Mesorhizobium sp. B3-1-6]TPI29425.1 DUF3800 domain-containing protein [Mesorhizobium sp. B3-1-6]
MIIPLKSGPTSISGHPLIGSQLTRFIYSDESGSSAKENVTVVASAIVHGDSQWRPLAERLLKIKRDVPIAIRDSFVFHATDLFSGKAYGEQWNRDQKPVRSWATLEKLCRIPAELKIPIAIGVCRRLDDLNKRLSLAGMDPGVLANLEPTDRVSLQVYVAFHGSVFAADRWLRFGAPDEVAMIIHEAGTEIDTVLKHSPKSLAKGIDFINQPPVLSIASVNVAKKDEEPLLQLADTCAFVARRYLAGLPGIDRFVDAIGFRAVLDSIKEGAVANAIYAEHEWETASPAQRS